MPQLQELAALREVQADCAMHLQDNDVQQHRFGAALWKYVENLARERSLTTFATAKEILLDDQRRWSFVVYANCVVSREWREIAMFVQNCHLRVQYCTEQLASQRPLVCTEVNECLEIAFQSALRNAQSVLSEAEDCIFVHGKYVLLGPDMHSLTEQNRRVFELVKERIGFAQKLQSEAGEYFNKISIAQSINASQALPHLDTIYTELVAYGRSHLDAIRNGEGIIWDVQATYRRKNSFSEAYRAVEYLSYSLGTADPYRAACWRSASNQSILSLCAVCLHDKEHHEKNLSVFTECAMALFDHKLTDPEVYYVCLAKHFADRVIEGNLTESEKKYVNLARDSNLAVHQALRFRNEDVSCIKFVAACHTALADWGSCEDDEDFFVVNYVADVHNDELFEMINGSDDHALLMRSWLHSIIKLLLEPTVHSAFCNILEFEGQVELMPKSADDASSFVESVRILCGARVLASRADNNDLRMKDLLAFLEQLVNAYQYVLVEYFGTADVHENLGFNRIDTAKMRRYVVYCQKAMITHAAGDYSLSECFQTAACREFDGGEGDDEGWCFEVISAHEAGDVTLTELLFVADRALRASTHAKHGQSVNALRMTHAAALEHVFMHRAKVAGNDAARDLHRQAAAAFDAARVKFLTAQRTKSDTKSKIDAKKLCREGEKLSEQAKTLCV